MVVEIQLLIKSAASIRMTVVKPSITSKDVPVVCFQLICQNDSEWVSSDRLTAECRKA